MRVNKKPENKVAVSDIFFIKVIADRLIYELTLILLMSELSVQSTAKFET